VLQKFEEAKKMWEGRKRGAGLHGRFGRAKIQEREGLRRENLAPQAGGVKATRPEKDRKAQGYAEKTCCCTLTE